MPDSSGLANPGARWWHPSPRWATSGPVAADWTPGSTAPGGAALAPGHGQRVMFRRAPDVLFRLGDSGI